MGIRDRASQGEIERLSKRKKKKTNWEHTKKERKFRPNILNIK